MGLEVERWGVVWACGLPTYVLRYFKQVRILYVCTYLVGLVWLSLVPSSAPPRRGSGSWLSLIMLSDLFSYPESDPKLVPHFFFSDTSYLPRSREYCRDCSGIYMFSCGIPKKKSIYWVFRSVNVEVRSRSWRLLEEKREVRRHFCSPILAILDLQTGAETSTQTPQVEPRHNMNMSTYQVPPTSETKPAPR
ncbi:hypothetical protein DFH27DRAFT_521209 [Peziza echinospora]|nr:hypothetical protein DFH27DRAFT_521209 [Peziza echinospora]